MLLRYSLRHLERWPTQIQKSKLYLYRNTSTKSSPYYITTPIFYPNAVPHIGHLYSLVIADIFARYQRLIEPNRPVKLLAGTDEHGLKIQKAALTSGLPPNEFCNKLAKQFRRLADKARITNTVFMRTTQPVHHRTVESVWNSLNAKGLIYKADYSGWYSVTDECFYTSAQVVTINTPSGPVTTSIETGASVEWQAEQNYMFRLSAFRTSLLEHYTSAEGNESIFPPQHQAQIVKILTEEPLEDLSISRPRSRLSWGIPVPGDSEHTIYVWFDALLVYLSGIGYPWSGNSKGIPDGWPANLQIIGKDIIRFHAIYLPAVLQALELPLQDRLLAHAHWTVEQKKMSKSVGNVADPFEAMDEFGVDVVRFYLARVGGRFRDDTDWSREQLEKHSREIQSLLGNLLLRVMSSKITTRASTAEPKSLLSIYNDLQSQSPHDKEGFGSSASALFELMRDTRALPSKVFVAFEKLEISDALAEIVELLRIANKAFTDCAPWKLTSTPAEVYACLTASLEALRVAGMLLQPFTPGVADQLLEILDVPQDRRELEHLKSNILEARWAEETVQLKVKEGTRLF